MEERSYAREVLLLARTMAMETSSVNPGHGGHLSTMLSSKCSPDCEGVQERRTIPSPKKSKPSGASPKRRERPLSPGSAILAMIKPSTRSTKEETSHSTVAALSADEVAGNYVPRSPAKARSFEMHISEAAVCEAPPAQGLSPPPTLPPSLRLSLDSSLPPSWEASTSQGGAAASPSCLQVSLFESLGLPPTASSPPWRAPMSMPTSPPTMPPSLPPMAMPLTPPSLPPMLAPMYFLPSCGESAPSWDAWSGDLTEKPLSSQAVKEVAGFSSPTTCSASDSESNHGLSSEDASLEASASETDLSSDFKHEERLSSDSLHEKMAACRSRVDVAVTPPPGLESCLCAWFWNASGSSRQCGHCKALANTTKATWASEKEPIRSLRLECLL